MKLNTVQGNFIKLIRLSNFCSPRRRRARPTLLQQMCSIKFVHAPALSFTELENYFLKDPPCSQTWEEIQNEKLWPTLCERFEDGDDETLPEVLALAPQVSQRSCSCNVSTERIYPTVPLPLCFWLIQASQIGLELSYALCVICDVDPIWL